MDTEPPFISIVVPTYNREEMLAEMLSSVLPYLSAGMEMIVVDDGSTDGTIAMLEKACQRWPALRFLQQANAGPGVARNRGVAESQAVWIAFLDSDDLWLPWAAPELHRLLVETPDIEQPEVLFLQVRGFSKAHDLTGWTQEQSRVVRHPTMYDMRLDAQMAMLGSCNLVMRRALFNRLGGFASHLFCGEDTDLFYRAGNSGEIWSVVSPVMIAYRLSNSDSLTRRQTDMKRAASHLLHQYNDGAYPGPEDKRDMALHKTIIFAIRSFFSKGYSKYAYQIYWEGLPLLIKVKDFHNILRFPLTPLLHLIKPKNYPFRWRPVK